MKTPRHASRRLRLSIFAALLVAAGAVRSARAEAVDFDPAKDAVPTILSAGDMTKIEALKSASFVYAYSRPSPSGKAIFAYLGGGLGFVHLDSGDIVPLPDSPSGGMADMGWRDDNTLAVRMIHTEVGPNNRVTITHGVDLFDATSGEVSKSEKITLPTNAIDIVAASPDVKTLLIVESNSTAPPPFKLVTLGQNPFDSGEGKPTRRLPGQVGAKPFGTFKVYQSAVGLALVDLAGGTHRPLISLPAGTAVNPNSISWSPDGAMLSLATTTMPNWDGDRQRDNSPPADGLPNLGSINVQEALGLVKPDANPLVTGTNLHLFITASGERQAVLQNTNYPQGLLAGLMFAPNGQGAVLAIALKSDLDGRPQPVYSYSSGIGWQVLGADWQPRRLLNDPLLESAFGAPEFLPDGTLLFAVPDETATRLVKVDPATGAMTTLWAPRGAIFQALVQAGRVFFTQHDVDRPMEFYAASATDAVFAAKRVTDLSPDARSASHIRSRDVSWQTSEGQTLHGIYVYPDWMLFPPPSPQPLVVWQQGGPGGQMTNDFGTSVEQPYTVFANLGIPVFVANAAGRNVRSPQFYSDMAEGRNFGQLDIRQIKEGVDALVARGIADPKAIGITGCSYGGYFTMQSIRSYPAFYAAANSQCSLVDLFEEFTFGYAPFISYLEGRAPTADPQEFKIDSPLYGTKDVKTPTLLFHGTLDFLPMPLINNAHDQLVANGTAVKLIRFVGERHGLGMEKSQAMAIQEQVKFFRDRLGVKPLPPEAERTAVHEVYVPSVARN